MENYSDYPNWFVTLCAVIFTVEALIGFAFNVAVLVLYHLNHRTLKNVSNILITNLNIIDMLICLVCCPMSLTYILSTRFHSTVICYLQEASVAFASTASAVNLLCISFDRYESIALPMNRKIKETNVKYIVALIWTLAMIAVLLPFSGYLELAAKDLFMEVAIDNKTVPCTFWLHKSNAYIVHELYFVTAFIISSLVTMICYYKVFHLAKQRLAARIAFLRTSLDTAGSKPLMDAKKQQDKRVTTMTLSIVCAFMVCWGPNMIVAVGAIFGGVSIYMEMTQTGLLCLAYLTTILHPLLYAFVRDNFREALMENWRSRQNKKQAKISPTEFGPPNSIQLVTSHQSFGENDELPTICRIIQPTNTVTVTIQDSLVYSTQ